MTDTTTSRQASTSGNETSPRRLAGKSEGPYEKMPTGWYVPGAVDPTTVPQPGPLEAAAVRGLDVSVAELRRALEDAAAMGSSYRPRTRASGPKPRDIPVASADAVRAREQGTGKGAPGRLDAIWSWARENGFHLGGAQKETDGVGSDAGDNIKQADEA